MAGSQSEPRPLIIAGPHRGVVEPDDIVHFTYSGDLELVHIEDMMAQIETHCDDITAVRLLINIDGLGAVEAAARKYIANQDEIAATALYGGSFAQRVVANLMIRAIGMVKTSAIPTRLFGVEADARSWLADLGERAHVR